MKKLVVTSLVIVGLVAASWADFSFAGSTNKYKACDVMTKARIQAYEAQTTDKQELAQFIADDAFLKGIVIKACQMTSAVADRGKVTVMSTDGKYKTTGFYNGVMARHCLYDDCAVKTTPITPDP